MSNGFWIQIKYPDILFDILTFNYTGMIESKILKTSIFIFASIVLIYVAIKIATKRKEDSNIKVCIWGLIVYFGVIFVSLILSIKTDIFTTRYTIPMIGLLIFAVSYIFSLEKKKWITIILASCIIMLFGINAYKFYLENYNESNQKITKIIDNNIQEDDIFIYREIGVGSIFAIKYPENKQIYFNAYHWTVEDAYKAYAPQMETVEDLSILDNIKGRIIVIDDGSTALYDELKEKQNIQIVKEPEKINSSYKNLNFTISILNKTN